MANNMIFDSTPEQAEVIITVQAELALGDSNTVIVAEAPAGAGKTRTAKNLMRTIQDEDEERLPEQKRKIGYFVFNTDMKSEMEYRSKLPDTDNPDDIGIVNTDFFTFHGFMKKQTEHNPLFKEYFYDKEGEYLVDGEKQSYDFKELKASSKRVLGTDSPSNTTTGFLKDMMGIWMKNPEGLAQFSKRISSEIYPKEKEAERIMSISEDDLKDIEDSLYKNKEALLKKAKLDIHAEPTKDLLMALYLMHGIDDVMKNNKYSHDGYYKKVFLLAKKHGIDLFEEFDFIIIDESQDVDPLIKELFQNSNRIKVLFGDRSQAIYGFRGAINFMEEMVKKEGTIVCPITASFRFPNDISVYSWVLLDEQEAFSGVKLVSSHVPEISSIDDELRTVEEATDSFITEIQDVITGEDFYDKFGVDIESASKREVQKYLSNHTAFVARNNATLLPTVFAVMNKLKSTEIQVEDRKTREMKSVQLTEYITVSLTKKISSEFKAIKDCTFNYRTRSRIQEAVGMPFYQYKEGKTLNDFLSDINVTTILAKEKSYSFLLNDKHKAEYDFLMKEMSSREKIDIPSSTLKNPDFKNIQMRKFTPEIRKKIETAMGMKFKNFKDTYILADMLLIPEVMKILKEDKDYHFLYDEKERAEFDDFCARTNAILASSRNPTLTLSTIHGLKGQEMGVVNINSDMMAENQEGIVTDDEIKLAYVAITRAKNKICFVENEGDLFHPMHDFLIKNKDKINNELKKDFIYTFPKDVSVKIFKENNLFFHEIKRKGEVLGLFGTEKPMSTIHLAYSSLEDEPLFFRLKEHDRKKGERMTYLTMEGEDMMYCDVPENNKINYRIGTPKHRTKEQEEFAVKRLENLKNTQVKNRAHRQKK